MGVFDGCGWKWKSCDECWRSMNSNEQPSYTDYPTTDKKITTLEQKLIQLEQYYTVMEENNIRLTNKCNQLEEKNINQDKNNQKIVMDMNQIVKTIESLEQRVSTIHFDKSNTIESDFIVIE